MSILLGLRLNDTVFTKISLNLGCRAWSNYKVKHSHGSANINLINQACSQGVKGPFVKQPRRASLYAVYWQLTGVPRNCSGCSTWYRMTQRTTSGQFFTLLCCVKNQRRPPHTACFKRTSCSKLAVFRHGGNINVPTFPLLRSN